MWIDELLNSLTDVFYVWECNLHLLHQNWWALNQKMMTRIYYLGTTKHLTIYKSSSRYKENQTKSL